MKTHNTDSKTSMYLQMGMAALLPGMQYAVELMQKQLDEFRAQLAALQNGDAPVQRGPGRPRKSLPVAGNGDVTAKGTPLKKGYWAQFTPEERVAEMRRRNEVHKQKQAAIAKMHPRDPRHPGHEKWLRKVSRAAKKRWAAKTPEQKREQLAKMAEGFKSARREAA